MFIKLKLKPGEYKYYNVNDIRSFTSYAERGKGSVLNLTYGIDIVEENPEEIYNMIRSEGK